MNALQPILALCAGLPVREFAAGETVLEDGQRSGRLYILDEGRVEIVKGTVQVATAAHRGAVFGEMSALLDQPHTATVRCLVPSRFFVAEQPMEFLRANPEACVAVARLLAERLGSVTRYLADLKAQFEDQKDHLGMVDEVLESLVQHQRKPR